MPDFTVHPFGAVICAQILDDYRFARAKDVTLSPAPSTAFPRGPFDLPVIRDCEADGAQHFMARAS